MFGVLLITLLITIMLVGSNMDTILKQGVVFQVRSEITENPAIVESFSSVQEFEAFIDSVFYGRPYRTERYSPNTEYKKFFSALRQGNAELFLLLMLEFPT